MAAMALAAMTQELSVMKQSLQEEVGRLSVRVYHVLSLSARCGFLQKALQNCSNKGRNNWCCRQQVESMKTELRRASDDSKRLTDKLGRLEEDNRQLEAMVSRLGGQDARKLKAQVTKYLGTDTARTHLCFLAQYTQESCTIHYL